MFEKTAPHDQVSRRLGALAVVAVACMTASFAAVPASASAAVRTGSVQDAQGDASGLSGPVLDIESAAVHYDDAAGTVRVTWTYYGDVRVNDYVDGGLWMDGPLASSTPSARAGWSHMPDSSGGPWTITTSLVLSYTAGTLSGTGTVSADGRVVTAEFTHAQLVGRDWQIGDGSVSNGDTVARFFFDGYSAPSTPQYPILNPPTPTDPGEHESGDQSMTINDGALYTNDPHVKLSIVSPELGRTLRVANDGGFRAAKVFAVKNTIRWRLASPARERLPKTVYLRFGNDAQTFTDDIILDQTDPVVASAALAQSAAATASAAPAVTAASAGRTYRVRVRAKDATSGRGEGSVRGAQQASPERTARIPAHQPLPRRARPAVRAGARPRRQLQRLACDPLTYAQA